MTINFHICSVAERQEIVDFLFSIGDELLLSKRSDAEEITDLLFEHGGAIAGYDGDAMVAVLGYFFGEPSRNYANKEVGFVYITGIAKSHRLSRTMWNGMGFVFRHLQEMGVREIRCHASEHDPYTNRLYSHFAKRLGNDVTLRGRPAILYGNTIEGVLAYLDKGKTQVSSRLEPIMQPSRARSVSHHPLVTSPPDGVLWHCSPCDVWWLSQASSSPESWRLERMPEIDFTEGDKLSQHEDKAPAWNVSGPSPLFAQSVARRWAQQLYLHPISAPKQKVATTLERVLMLDNSQVTKMVRRHLRNPLLSVKSWSCQQDGNDDKGSPVFRVHGYIIDPIAYELEGTPIPFELHFSLSARPVE